MATERDLRESGRTTSVDQTEAPNAPGHAGRPLVLPRGQPVVRLHGYQQAIGRRIAEAIADLLAVGRRFAGSMRLARLAKTRPAIHWFQTVGSLKRQHPPWILRGKSADLIQLLKLVLSECEVDRREVVL
jgi:hypothetical protein